KTVAIWGLSFKPNTDDIRFAPSIYIIDKLLENEYTIKVHDPAAMKHIQKKYQNKLQYFENQYDATKNVSALIILTEWNEFKQIDFEKLKSNMNDRFIFDGRNIYDIETMKQNGFSYFSVGRKSVI
ncbi:MAG: UDP-glucose/GDP-mannose dehydrogenase family protein, partial [bacterium]|nr:UDP-glucose/GDP-mannose dehydrogenase family protein [bacterium]